MTGPTPPAAGEPEDVQPDETSEYWIGYYDGKAAAMRILGTVYRTHRDLDSRIERRGSRVWRLFYFFATLSTAGFAWNIAISSPSWWIYLSQGAVFGMALADLVYRAGRR